MAKDPTPAILAIADRLAPCSHLAVWSEARRDLPEVDPSTVWRAIVLSGRFHREASSGHFRRVDG